MDLSPQQQSALASVKDWVNSDQQVFRLFGYAGTGKTTIAHEFAKTVGGEVLYGAYTGKAALVLQTKGCPAKTLHRLIYLPKQASTERVEELEMAILEAKQTVPMDDEYVAELQEEFEVENERVKNPSFSINPESPVKTASLLVVDEVSMVGQQMARDLLSFGTKILVLGDPAQLPPVGSKGFFIDAEPDFLLTEIHRQAKDSPVLQIADLARRGEPLLPGSYGLSRIVQRGTLTIEDVAAHDQIIVGTNRARRDINRAVRGHLGRTSSLPEPGDRLVCLRNNYERGLLNGSQWEVLSADQIDDDKMYLDIRGDGITQSLVAWTHYFQGREKELSHWEVRDQEAFDFGYAITCHKAQGSQWDNVCVIDESRCFRSDSRKWLYTAITRAARSLTIVQQ